MILLRLRPAPLTSVVPELDALAALRADLAARAVPNVSGATPDSVADDAGRVAAWLGLVIGTTGSAGAATLRS